jgi:CheY-like chemotaxis protein
MHAPRQSEDEPGLFLDDESGAHEAGHDGAAARQGEDSAAHTGVAPWRILIVDDDVDVHVVTKFALSTASFQGRRLAFVHAYSAAEALVKLRETPDIALILLDVIMETADAGLQLARQVREQLGNALVRIILRTGQPGQAVEHSIIVDYDINDFWSKADLTTRKLFTTVIAALRAYATLAAAATQRDTALRHLANAEARLHAARLAVPMLVIGADGIIHEANHPACALLQRDQAELHKRNAAELKDFLTEDTIAAASAALEAHGSWSGNVDIKQSDGAIPVQASATRLSDGSLAIFASPSP